MKIPENYRGPTSWQEAKRVLYNFGDAASRCLVATTELELLQAQEGSVQLAAMVANVYRTQTRGDPKGRASRSTHPNCSGARESRGTERTQHIEPDPAQLHLWKRIRMNLSLSIAIALSQFTVPVVDRHEEDRNARLTSISIAVSRAAERATCTGEFAVDGCRRIHCQSHRGGRNTDRVGQC